MEQIVTGTIHGKTIVLDAPLNVPDGQNVEVVVREARGTPSAGGVAFESTSPPAWWTEEDDQIFDEIEQARKHSTRPEIVE